MVATCGVIEFELGWATRSSAELDQLRADRDAGYEWLATLLIAAVAERERVTVMHYDGDYDFIAQVTGQPMQWVVPRGTVP